MKYIFLTKDERFNVLYNQLVGKTRKNFKQGDYIDLKIWLYETETLKTKQWVVCQVIEQKDKYIKVKVVNL